MHYQSINTYEPRGPCACCTGSRLRLCGWLLLIFGAALAGLGTWLPSAIDIAISDGIKKEVVLTEEFVRKDSDAFVKWRDNTQPDSSAEYYYVYALNLTNPYEVLQGAKPVLQERGPYVYRVLKRHFNISLGRDRDQKKTISYRKWEWYRFERALTDPALDPEKDIYVSTNMVFQGMANMLGGLVSLFYNQYPEVDRLFVRRSLHEILWGYVDPVLEKIHEMFKQVDPFYSGLLGNTTSFEEAVKIQPELHTIYTGEDYPLLMRQYLRFNGQQYLECNGKPAWGSTDANRIYGTDGTQFAPGVEKNSTVTVWVDTVKREVPLYNNDGETVKVKGIEMLRFRLPKWMMQNETTNPDNAAYYMHYEGMINYTTCAPYHIPIFFSKPHFLDAAPEVASKVEGFAPDPEKHDLFLDVEPMTGITMHAAKRLQVNVLLRPLKVGQETWFSKLLPDLFLPSVWLEDGGVLTDKQADQFKGSLGVAVGLKRAMPFVGYIIGTVLTFTGFILAVYVAPKRDYPVD